MTPACVTKSRLSCLAAWLQGWYRKKTHLPGQLPVILSSENGLWKMAELFPSAMDSGTDPCSLRIASPPAKTESFQKRVRG